MLEMIPLTDNELVAYYFLLESTFISKWRNRYSKSNFATHILSNSSGYFFRISEALPHGRCTIVCIPEGNRRSGWATFENHLTNSQSTSRSQRLISLDPFSTITHPVTPSYGETASPYHSTVTKTKTEPLAAVRVKKRNHGQTEAKH